MKVRLDAAQAAYDGLWKEFAAGRGTLESNYEWSVKWSEVALVLAQTKQGRVAIAEAHLARMREIIPIVQADEERRPSFHLWASKFYVAEAEIRLARAKDK